MAYQQCPHSTLSVFLHPIQFGIHIPTYMKYITFFVRLVKNMLCCCRCCVLCVWVRTIGNRCVTAPYAFVSGAKENFCYNSMRLIFSASCWSLSLFLLSVWYWRFLFFHRLFFSTTALCKLSFIMYESKMIVWACDRYKENVETIKHNSASPE